ncbi:MFS transporter [Rubrobacter aplysinae]|uniref:MFS transporter n=1 Tax=Rubrobacter aplysinae TaxID=909625 RepID=UPI000A035A44|nr:MFS transporter [Rubrobacter aplysinae]
MRRASDSDAKDERSTAAAGNEALDEKPPVSARPFLVVVALAVFVTVLTGNVVNVVIPLMREEFGASAAGVGWIITGYALAYAIGVPLYGRVSDFFGVRRVFALGLLGFAAGGLVCALAPSLSVLVAGRILQGIGGAAVPALATVSVAKVLPPGERGAALGVVASSVGVGSAAGPVVGGIVGQFAGWRPLFLGTLVLMLLLVPFALRVLPGGASEDERRGFDLLGGVLLGLGAGLFLFGITQGQGEGFASFSSWGSFLGAVVALVGFVRRINAVSEPFVSASLFRNRAYVAALIVGFLASLVNLSVLFFVPMLLVEVNGLSAGAAGIALTPGAVALAVLSPFTGRLSDRTGARLPLVAGLALMGLSALFVSTFAGASPVLIAAGVVGVGSGFALVQSPANNAAANALPEEEIGGGLGIFSGAFFLGSGTGPALIGALLAARQEAGLDAINPMYTQGAAPFSDGFLALGAVALVALVAATRLREGSGKSKGGG